MGFRGEALPSIASVSRFTLTTRERDSESPEATRIQVQGKLMQVEAAASPPGTTIEVRQLFYNLPARRKFLKTKETEKSHISQYLRLAALAHPEVGFKLIQDQRTLWHLNPIECDGSQIPECRLWKSECNKSRKTPGSVLLCNSRTPSKPRCTRNPEIILRKKTLPSGDILVRRVSDDPHAVTNGCSSTVVRSRTRP